VLPGQHRMSEIEMAINEPSVRIASYYHYRSCPWKGFGDIFD